jgi:hexosaminidase
MAPARYVGLLALSVASLLPSGVLALWPIPNTLETGMTALKVSPSFYFDVQIEGAPGDLYDAVGQAQYYLETDQLGRLVVGRGANDTTALASAKTLSSLTLSLTSGATPEPIASEAIKPLGTRSEEYALTIPADGSAATLTANSTLGLYRGLTTFNQLFYYYGGVTYTLLAPIAITDTPAYVSSHHIIFHVSRFNPMHIALPRTWAGYI